MGGCQPRLVGKYFFPVYRNIDYRNIDRTRLPR
jgi:hypothetical protein